MKDPAPTSFRRRLVEWDGWGNILISLIFGQPRGKRVVP